MRAAALFTIILLGCGGLSAQRLHFSPVQRNDILQRVKNPPATTQGREQFLKDLFQRSGCDGQNLEEQRPANQEQPNLICRLPGQSDDAVIIGAHYDLAVSNRRPIDNWTGAVLLPALFECLRNRKRQHTFIFVAFADKGAELQGAEFFAAHLPAAELAHIKAMVNLDALGLSPTKVWTAHSDRDLVQALLHTVYAMKLPASQIDIEAAGPTDSQPFASRNIPQITIHSMTQQNLLSGTASAFRAGNYYDSYRLVCGYVAFLDTQKTRPRG
jgi:hypothetical protein